METTNQNQLECDAAYVQWPRANDMDATRQKASRANNEDRLECDAAYVQWPRTNDMDATRQKASRANNEDPAVTCTARLAS